MILADQFSGDGFNPKSERFKSCKLDNERPDQNYLERWSSLLNAKINKKIKAF